MSEGKTSRIVGFYKRPLEERVKIVKEFAGLSDEEANLLLKEAGLDLKTADLMIENVIGTFPLPLGIATNFLINGKDYLVPMAIEETSVVAAASYAAKLCRAGGGITSIATEPIMIGQVQLTKVKNPYDARIKILEKKEEILKIANAQDPILVKLGGGAKDIEVRVVNSPLFAVRIIISAPLRGQVFPMEGNGFWRACTCRTLFRLVLNPRLRRLVSIRSTRAPTSFSVNTSVRNDLM